MYIRIIKLLVKTICVFDVHESVGIVTTITAITAITSGTISTSFNRFADFREKEGKKLHNLMRNH